MMNILRNLLVFIITASLSFSAEYLVSKEFTDATFTAAALSTWSLNYIYTCPVSTYIDFYQKTFVGEFGLGENESKTFSLPPHWSLQVRLDFMMLASFDAPDFVYVNLDSTSQQFPKDPSEGIVICEVSAWPDVLILHSHNYTHSAATATFTYKTQTDEGKSNEASIFRNFFIYVDKCHPTCLTCSGPTYVQCLTCPSNSIVGSSYCNCKPGYLSYEHTCVTSCPAGYAASIVKNECILNPCNANCSSCNTVLQKCIACAGGYYLENGYCVTSCSVTAPASGGICVNLITSLGLINGGYLINGLMNNYFGESEIKGLGLSASGFLGNRGTIDTSAMTSECGSYHIMGGAFLAGTGAKITGSWTGLNPHWSLLIGYKFMKIDTWDQEYATLTIDGTVYIVGQYATALETVDICGIACADYLYPIVKNVTHSSTSLNVIISSTLDSGNYDESWGIRELYILIDYCTENCAVCSAAGCTTCVSGYVMYHSKCVLYCPDGSYESTSLTCTDCNPLCKTCDFSGNCLTCYTSTYLYNGSCVSTCPDGYWSSDIQGICLQCHQTCETCAYPGDAISCLKCASSYYFYNYQCLTSCPQGTFPTSVVLNHLCSPCDSTCTTCSGAASSNCLTCTSPRYLQSASNTCVTACNSNQFINTSLGKCDSCDSTCTTCSGALPFQCLTCSGSYFLHSDTNRCSLTCNSNQYKNTSNNQCTACDSTCLTCSDGLSTNCLTCSLPLFFQASSNSCVSSCNSNQYSVVIPIPKCLSCDTSCATCSGPLSTNCLSCSGSYSLNTSTNECVTSCPSNTFIESALHRCTACESTCKTCSGSLSSNCLTCALPLFFLASITSCVAASNCPSNQFANSSTVACQACDASCLTCSGPLSTNCLTCQGSYKIDSSTNLCVSSCPDGYSIYGTSLSCQPCSSNCLTCSGPGSDNCITCRTSKVMYKNSCLSKCPSLTFKDQSGKQCQSCNEICKDACSGSNKEDCNGIKTKYQIIVYIFSGKSAIFIVSLIAGFWIDARERKRRSFKIAPLRNIHNQIMAKDLQKRPSELSDNRSGNEESLSILHQPHSQMELSPAKINLKANQKLKYFLLGNEWISLFYYFDDSLSRVNRVSMIYFKYLAFFVICYRFKMEPLYFVAMCVSVSVAYKYVVTIVARFLSMGALFANEIICILQFTGIGVCLLYWFLPELDILSYKADQKWSFIYALSFGIDFFICQPLLGLASYFAAVSYLNARSTISFISSIFLNKNYLFELKEIKAKLSSAQNY